MNDECECGATGSGEGHTEWCNAYKPLQEQIAEPASSAIISPCGQYRYALTRKWGRGPTALFIMLNPSTADALSDDPTIRRCMSFALREGCGGLRVENLFAYRATDPAKMFANIKTAVGDTDRYIAEAAGQPPSMVIAAWGADKRATARGKEVLGLLKGMGVRPVCLGESKAGAPRHPLYLAKTAPLIPFETRP